MVASLSLKKNQETNSSSPPPAFYFQAVGILRVQVKIDEANNFTIILNEKEYRLLYPPQKKQIFTFLQKEMERTKSDVQKLIVYPHAQHYPDKNKLHSLNFSLIGYVGKKRESEENLISQELEDGEFFIKGFWNFLPVCRIPCISVFKNYFEERKKQVTELTPLSQKYFLKPSHLPVLWKDAPVSPFRYNSKLPKDKQKEKYFVGIKADFLSERDCFKFKSLILPPLTKKEAPRFLKFKKD